MHHLRTGVRNNKRAGAVGALGFVGGKTRLTKQRRLLVARHAPDRQAIGDVWHRSRGAEVTDARSNLGQHLFWNGKQFQHVVVP